MCDIFSVTRRNSNQRRVRTHRHSFERMAAAMTSRAIILALALLRGTLAADANHKDTPLSRVGATTVSPFFGQTVVNLTSVNDEGENPLVLRRSALDEAASCDGVARTIEGSGVLSGKVTGPFSLADVNVTTLLRCGVREAGEPVFDVTTVGSIEGPLAIGSEKSLSSFSLKASIYDDTKTGRHYIAGHLKDEASDEGSGAVYWFDTCAGSFEVGS